MTSRQDDSASPAGGESLRDFLERNRRDIEGWPSSLKTWLPGAKTPNPRRDDRDLPIEPLAVQRADIAFSRFANRKNGGGDSNANEQHGAKERGEWDGRTDG